jgi:hypothetical protein
VPGWPGLLGDWQRRLQDPLDPSTQTLRAVARAYGRLLRRPWLLYSGAIFWLLVTVGLVLQLAGAEPARYRHWVTAGFNLWLVTVWTLTLVEYRRGKRKRSRLSGSEDSAPDVEPALLPVARTAHQDATARRYSIRAAHPGPVAGFWPTGRRSSDFR